MADNLITPLNEAFDAAYQKAVKTFGLTKWRKPHLNIVSLRGTTAGKAVLKENQIQINWALYKQNQTTFLERTLVHEVAHLVNFQVHGSQQDGHGMHWKTIMRRMGATDITPCHTYNTSSVREIKGMLFEYRCSGALDMACRYVGYLNSATHHKINLDPSLVYRCRYCKSRMEYTKKMVAK